MEFQIDEAVDILSRTPATLYSLLRDLSDTWAINNEGEGTWSPYDVVGHLIHGEETDWIPRARIILEQGEARPFDTFDRTAQFEKSKGKSLDQLLDEFTALRKSNIEALAGLNITPDKLARRGLHPQLGPVTLGQLLATWVAHDLDHVAQLARVMSKQYTEAVGPWKQYLSILNERIRE